MTSIMKWLRLVALLVCILCKSINLDAASISLIKSEIKTTTVTWKQVYNIKMNKSLTVDLNCDNKKDNIVIGMDSPNGTRVSVIVNNKGFNLLDISKVYKESSLFDDFGDLDKNCYIQVSVVDLTKDKKPEIIVAVGDGLVNLNVGIFKYTGKGDFFYKEIGYIEGQEKIVLMKDFSIIAPYGSQGLFSEYKYNKTKDRFVQTY